MIVVVGGIKGGSGKTTVATHLAILGAHAGWDVLLIDADDQETATDFTVLRHARRAGGGAVPASSSPARPSARTRNASLPSTIRS